MTHDSKSVARRYVAALQRGDEETVRELFADDASWTLAAGDLPIAGTWAGRDAILGEFLARALDALRARVRSRLEITGLIAEGEQVALQWTSHARTRDGRDRTRTAASACSPIRGGRIQTVREYMDTLYARETAFGDDRAMTSHSTPHNAPGARWHPTCPTDADVDDREPWRCRPGDAGLASAPPLGAGLRLRHRGRARLRARRRRVPVESARARPSGSRAAIASTARAGNASNDSDLSLRGRHARRAGRADARPRHAR